VVCGCALDAAHFGEADLEAGFGQLPRGFGTGEAAADDVNVVHGRPIAQPGRGRNRRGGASFDKRAERREEDVMATAARRMQSHDASMAPNGWRWIMACGGLLVLAGALVLAAPGFTTVGIAVLVGWGS
jgi:hypothetical protein